MYFLAAKLKIAEMYKNIYNVYFVIYTQNNYQRTLFFIVCYVCFVTIIKQWQPYDFGQCMDLSTKSIYFSQVDKSMDWPYQKAIIV